MGVRYVLISLGLLLGFALVFGSDLNTFAHKGYFGSDIRQVSQFLLPKSDLYDYVVNQQVNFEFGTEIHFTVKHAYAGFYSLGVLTADLQNPIDTTVDESSVRLCCFHRPEPICMQGSVYPFWATESDGMAMFEYSVPEDLPIDTGISCAVNFDQQSASILSELGTHAVYASKRSET